MELEVIFYLFHHHKITTDWMLNQIVWNTFVYIN
jgi:hypothetical protein